MAKADCGFCEAMGFRACDSCGGPAWAGDGQNQQNLFLVDGAELCGYCVGKPAVQVVIRP